MFDELPHQVKDIAVVKNYSGKRLWSIVGKTRKRFSGKALIEDDDATLKFRASVERVDSLLYDGMTVTSIEGDSRVTLMNSSYIENYFVKLTNKNYREIAIKPQIVTIQETVRPPIMKVNNVKGYLPGLGIWFRHHTLDFDMEGYNFKNYKPLTHTIELASHAKVTLVSQLKLDEKSRLLKGEFKAIPESYVRIEWNQAQTLDGTMALFGYVESFFNFIFSQPHSTHILSSRILSRSSAGQKDSMYILNRYNSGHVRGEWVGHNTELFGFNQVTNFNDIFIKWILEYERIGEAADVLVLLRSSNISEKMRFTSLVNALESVHRRYYDEQKESLECHNERLKRILERIESEEDRKFAEVRLKYPNEMSLKERLASIYRMGKLHNIEPPSKSVRYHIIETRNYFTHGDKRRADDALEGLELMKVNDKLAQYLKFLLLKVIDIVDDELTEIVRASRQFESYYRDMPPSRPYVDWT